MEQGAPTPSVTDLGLARRLRALRLARQWTLDDLAGLSGVSRASLSRIENSEVSATAAALGRLAAAFGLTMSRLLAEVERDQPALLPPERQPLWIDPETGFRRRSLSPPAPDFECELLSYELPPGATIAYPAPPRAGLEHHLFLQDGALELTIHGDVHRLKGGDCLRYRLYGASAFKASGKRPARYILAIR
jgi:transcriptional regulator with XRE-family HTH domain